MLVSIEALRLHDFLFIWMTKHKQVTLQWIPANQPQPIELVKSTFHEPHFPRLLESCGIFQNLSEVIQRWFVNTMVLVKDDLVGEQHGQTMMAYDEGKVGISPTVPAVVGGKPAKSLKVAIADGKCPRPEQLILGACNVEGDSCAHLVRLRQKTQLRICRGGSLRQGAFQVSGLRHRQNCATFDCVQQTGKDIFGWNAVYVQKNQVFRVAG